MKEKDKRNQDKRYIEIDRKFRGSGFIEKFHDVLKVARSFLQPWIVGNDNYVGCIRAATPPDE